MPIQFSDPTPFLYRPGALFLGLDGWGREIGIKTEVHAITIGGSGAGKGSALLVPNSRRWPHNLICIDPKGENAVLSWEAREALGQRVAILDPFHEIPAGKIPDRLRVSINPLRAINPEDRRARAALLAVGNGLVVVHDPRHMEWAEGARALLSGLAAFVVADAPAEMRTFAMLRKFLMQPDDALLADARTMAQDGRIGGLIRAAGVTLITALESDRGMEKDFLGLARRATQWLDDDAIAESLENSDFDISELKTAKASLFVVLPADYLAGYSGFLRLFVKAALHAMSAPAESAQECLFLLDEFYSLGKLDELTEAAGRMRSYGVHLWPFLQGLGQLHALYGREGSQAFLTNADAHIFLGNDKDDFTLEYISRRLGNVGPGELAPPPEKKPFKQSFWRGHLTREGQMTPDGHNAQNRWAADEENRMRAYQYETGGQGRPRLTPEEIAQIVGKNEMAGDKVARSMIVFGPAGTVLNLLLSPYFQTPPPKTVVPSAEENAQMARKAFLISILGGIFGAVVTQEVMGTFSWWIVTFIVSFLIIQRSRRAKAT